MSQKPQIVRQSVALFGIAYSVDGQRHLWSCQQWLYYAFFDTAINQYLTTVGGLDITQGGIIGFAAESHCRYMQALAFPDVVEVGLRVASWGIQVCVTNWQSSKRKRHMRPRPDTSCTCLWIVKLGCRLQFAGDSQSARTTYRVQRTVRQGRRTRLKSVL